MEIRLGEIMEKGKLKKGKSPEPEVHDFFFF